MDNEARSTAAALRDVQYAKSSNLPSQAAEQECEVVMSECEVG